jgi:uncharacterized cupredoxin-like copper-binding protein
MRIFLMTKMTWLGSTGMKLIVGLFVLTLAACTNADGPPSGMEHDQMHHSMTDMDQHGMITMQHDQMHSDEMDHGSMDHGAMEHGAMDHGAMDHGSMDHGAMEHGAMDHGAMDHGAMDHGAMDQGTMKHGAMDQTAMDQMAGRHDGMDQNHGTAGMASDVDRVVNVTAIDIAFEPNSISVRPGETVRFVVTNDGAVDHEFVIGDASAQVAHAEQMAAMGTGMDHSHMNAMSLKPGETKELVWTFETGQDLQFACHVAGHYTAGMKGRIEIAR